MLLDFLDHLAHRRPGQTLHWYVGQFVKFDPRDVVGWPQDAAGRQLGGISYARDLVVDILIEVFVNVAAKVSKFADIYSQFFFGLTSRSIFEGFALFYKTTREIQVIFARLNGPHYKKVLILIVF